MKKSRLAIFASGAGTNAEAIMSFFQHHEKAEVVVLLSNNPAAPALERASKFNVPTRVFTKEQFADSDIVLDWLRKDDVTHIVLAGFLLLIPPALIRAFPGKIINIHPSLLPKFSGKGMYGMNVHRAVQKAAEKESGITIHLVNERYDDGRILFQASCTLDKNDLAEDIALKIHKLEYEHFPRVIESFVS